MKNLIAILMLLFSSLTYGQALSDSLLLHYPFSGNAYDVSLNGFNGIVNATLTTDRFGNPDEAYSFNGVNEFIDLPNDLKLKPELPVSFSFWVKLDDLQPESSTFFSTDFAQNNHTGVWMSLTPDGNLAVSYGDASGNTSSPNRRSKIGSAFLDVDIWYHIVSVVKGALDMDIYLNGINDEGVYAGTGGDLGYTDVAGSIGRKDSHLSLPPYYFMGALDDFRYWNRELTLTDVDSLYNNLYISIDKVNTKTELLAYPNPSKGILHIESNNDFEFSKTRLYNTLGQIVYEEAFKTEIVIDQLQKGVYLLQITPRNKLPLKMIKIIKD